MRELEQGHPAPGRQQVWGRASLSGVDGSFLVRAFFQTGKMNSIKA
jgi:hypothetical protein